VAPVTGRVPNPASFSEPAEREAAERALRSRNGCGATWAGTSVRDTLLAFDCWPRFGPA